MIYFSSYSWQMSILQENNFLIFNHGVDHSRTGGNSEVFDCNCSVKITVDNFSRNIIKMLPVEEETT